MRYDIKARNRPVQLTLAPIVLAATQACAQSGGIWETVSSIPTGGLAKSHSIAIGIGDSFYVLGGPPWYNGAEDGSVYRYNTATNVWGEEIGFDGMGVLLSQGGGLDALGRIVIFGGDNPAEPGSEPLPFEWDPNEGPWHDLAARGASAPSMWFADCTDELGRIYSFGGGPNGGGTPGSPNSNYAERYNANTDNWQPLAPLPIAVADAAASLDGLGHILVFGGFSANGSSRISTVQQYDIATNSWQSTANAEMPVALTGHEAVLGGDGRIYILGGNIGAVGTSTTQNEVHVYDPVTDTWALGPSMSEPRCWFAAGMGPGNYLYVFGGDNNSSGTASTERIYTTPCPVVFDEPADFQLWGGSTIFLHAPVAGGGSISYQWEKDGSPLTDGPSASGGTIAGATTDSMTISGCGAADAGSYALIATNSCGTDTGNPTLVTVRTPVDIPTHWEFTSLHPSIAENSYATAVDQGVQVGRAVFDTPEYNNIDHPWVWTSTAASGRNLTPPNSQGGSVHDIGGDLLVGWWWEPLSCYVSGQLRTCYYQRAARWDFAGNFYDTSYSGFEYTTMTATDGVSIVGSGATDDASGNYYNRAVIWPQPDYWYAQSIHPSFARNSSVSAVEGNDQFGSVSLPFAVVQAAKWSGSAGSYVDMHPTWASNSTISDASDGQQVGTSNQWTDSHALLWAGTPGSLIDLHPTGALKSSAVACDSGLQIGSVIWEGQTTGTPVIWSGNALSVVEIAPTLPAQYSSFNVADIDVDDGGSVYLVGSAYNTISGRNEAMLLTSTPAPTCVADTNGDGVLSPADFSAWVAAFNTQAPACDQNIDGACTPADFSAWVANFNAGC